MGVKQNRYEPGEGGNAASGNGGQEALTDTGDVLYSELRYTGNRSQTTVTINNIDRTGPLQ